MAIKIVNVVSTQTIQKTEITQIGYSDSDLLPSYDFNNSAAVFTGLVIDTTGLNLQRCMSPKVIDETGREIYGTMYVDDNYLLNQGILSYASNNEMISKIKNGTSRAGSNPIIVRATGVANHGFNMIISKADGDRILAANQRDGFLQRCAVVARK